MVLLPTGSNKILEVHTSEINIVIKTKKAWSGISTQKISSVIIDGNHIKQINILAVESDTECKGAEFGRYEIAAPPLFFEQTDYEIIIRSMNGQKVRSEEHTSELQSR